MVFKLNSFSTRLSLYIVSAVGLFFIVSFLLYFSFSSKAIKVEIFQKSENQLDYVTKSVDAILESMEYTVNLTAFYMEQILDQPEFFEPIIHSMIVSNPSICGGSVALEPYFYGKDKEYYMLYGYCLNTENKGLDSEIEFKMLGAPEYDYHNLDWYRVPKQLNQNYWSEPYFDEGAGNIAMTTYTKLLHNKDGEFIGVISADIALDWFTDMVLENKPYEDSYAFMLSRNAYFLVHQDRTRILNYDFFSANSYMDDASTVFEIGREMIAGNAGNMRFNRDGVNSYAFYKPIPRAGWSICTVSTEETMLAEFNKTTQIIIRIAISSILLIFIFTVLVIRSLSKPLESFSRSASKIAEGNFDVILPEIKTKDEMCELRNAFVHMQTSLKEYVAELKNTTAERERIGAELEIAQAIQMGMLPMVFPPFPHHESIDLYAKLTPAKEVGGDLYDFFIQDDKLFFAVGDASGKGVPASLLMAVTISLFRSTASYTHEPEKILTSLNNLIAESNETNMFITLFVGVLDLNTGLLNYSNAGHNPPVLISSTGEVSFMQVNPNLALGIFSNVNFSTQSIQIDINTAIFAYSDGLTEAENAAKELYSEERLIEVIKENITCNSQQMLLQIEKSVENFVLDNEQSDDLTMLMLSYKLKNND